MSFVCNCPKCGQPVTVPDGVAAEAHVRCPLCAVIYPLGDALAAAPPALIPVDSETPGGLKADSPESTEAGLISEPFHAGDAEGTSASADVQAAASSEEDAEGPQLDVWNKVGESPQIATGADDETTAEGTQDEVHAETFAFLDDDRSGDEPLGGLAAASRRRKKEKSLVKELAGVVIGGFLGLAIGYYALNWFGGSRFDFLKIYLPGVAHTAPYRPAFLQTQTPQQPVDVDPKSDDKRPKPADDWPPSQRPAPSELQTPDEPWQQGDTGSPDAESAQPPQRDNEPEPAPLPEGHIGLREPPSFGPDELRAAVKAARDAVRAEKTSDQITPDTYRLLCQLGHVLSRVEGDDTDARLAESKQAARQMLRDLRHAPGKADELEALAGELLTSDETFQGGILLAGTVAEVAARDGLYAVTLQMASMPQPPPVLSEVRPLFEAGDRALILGTVVNSPAENMVGYAGPEARVILAAMAVGVSQAPKLIDNPADSL